MLSIEIGFPTGRYHATPWNHHVNEGLVEWPPSPWRLMRAIVATRHLKADDNVPETQLRRLIEILSRELPHYRVPRGTASHTRHYMPMFKDSTTKIFDTFIHVDRRDTLQIIWPQASLLGSDRDVLALLLGQITYLGRAESWVEARLMHTDEAPALANVLPSDGDRLQEGYELIRVMAPLPAAEFAEWRSLTLERELERQHEAKRQREQQKGKEVAKVKLTPADRRKIEATLPEDIFEALHVDTGALRKAGWSIVPGARWMDYCRPVDLLTLAPSRRVLASGRLPTAARFAIASQVPPRLTEALSLADRIRAALMSRSDGHPVFSGRNTDGALLRNHRHAFILPEANARHGRISHVTLYAPMGFDFNARRALDGLRDVWGRGGHDVQLVLLGIGQPEDFAGHDVQAGQCPILASAAAWISRTPFVSTRHLKTTNAGSPKLDDEGVPIGSPEHDLRRLLRETGFPRPARIDHIEATSLGGKLTRWLDFKTLRPKGGGLRATTRGSGFRIVFAEAVSGPIALGYGAHFGLGLFHPELVDPKERFEAFNGHAS